MHNGSYSNTEIRFFLLLVLNLSVFSHFQLFIVFLPFYQPPTRQIPMPLYTEHVFVLFFTLNTYIIPSGYTISKVSVLPQFYHSFKISSMRSRPILPDSFGSYLYGPVGSYLFYLSCWILGYQEYSLFRRHTNTPAQNWQYHWVANTYYNQLPYAIKQYSPNSE